MSVSLFLVPLAAAVITSAVAGVSGVVYACNKAENGVSEKIMTRFKSEEMLRKTLTEHGVPVETVSADCMVASFGGGKIRYERAAEGEPYTMQIFGVEHMDDLICNVEAIESEYGSNLQSYLYDRVKANLPENMQVQSEEVLEDNSILLTVAVD